MDTGEAMNFRKMKFAGLVVLAMLVFASTFHAQQAPGPGEKPATVMPDVLQVPAPAQP
jgi:hypothetical protein